MSEIIIREDEEGSAGSPDPTPIDARLPLHIVKSERTIFELHRQWKLGVLKLDPQFQREFVWHREKQIELIESVLARVPLPVFYLSEEDEEQIIVVDGQQRLTTLFAFMDGYFPANQPSPISRFVLNGLKFTPEYNDHCFEKRSDVWDRQDLKELSVKERRRFESTPLTCFILQPGTTPAAKFEVFRRLNQGAAILNPQEIRNALFGGPGLVMVRALAAPGGRFREVAGADREYGSRKRADELVLRALAFLWRPWREEYKGDLQSFLNDTLTRLNSLSVDQLEALQRRFLYTLELTQFIFPDHAFERYDPSRGWAGHLSGPLVEVTMAVLSHELPVAPSAGVAREILTRFQRLCGEPVFESAILSATQTRKNLLLRMDRFTEIVRAAKYVD